MQLRGLRAWASYLYIYVWKPISLLFKQTRVWNIYKTKNKLIMGKRKIFWWVWVWCTTNYFAVQALREIAMQIGKKDWNFGVDPCSQDPSWLTPQSNLRPLYNNSLVCNCSDSLGQCHVIEMYAPFIFLPVMFQIFVQL